VFQKPLQEPYQIHFDRKSHNHREFTDVGFLELKGFYGIALFFGVHSGVLPELFRVGKLVGAASSDQQYEDIS
jgi:hypothetical protein